MSIYTYIHMYIHICIHDIYIHIHIYIYIHDDRTKIRWMNSTFLWLIEPDWELKLSWLDRKSPWGIGAMSISSSFVAFRRDIQTTATWMCITVSKWLVTLAYSKVMYKKIFTCVLDSILQSMPSRSPRLSIDERILRCKMM